MAHRFSHRLPAPLALAAAASLFAAAPALATEGPAAPAGPSVPAPLVLPNFAPMPAPAAPGVRQRVRPVIRRARLASRRIRRGHGARLRLSLSEPGRLRIVIQRRVRGRLVRARVLTVAARTPGLSVRIPGRSHGHALFAGRYRITVVAIDADGDRSRPVRRLLIVRHRHH